MRACSGNTCLSGGGEPTFSVLIAAHDAEATIGDTLSSLVAQTDPDWEACVVDDGSRDGTLLVAQRYAALDSRIRVYAQANRGAAAARNEAARHAGGRYICILDSDDAYRDTYLERQRALMLEHPGFDLYSCNADGLYETGEIRPFFPDFYPQQVVSLRLEDIIERDIIFVAAVVGADLFRSLGGFRESVYVEDYDLWLRLLASGGRHIHNPEALVIYRVRTSSKSSFEVQRLESLNEVFEHLSSHFELDGRVLRLIEGQMATNRHRLPIARAEQVRHVLEDRLCAGQYAHARSFYWESRRAFPNTVKFLAGLIMVVASPRILARVLCSSDRMDGAGLRD